MYSQLLPDGLAQETIGNLALLFPQSDPKTRRSVSGDVQLDLQLVKCGQLRTEKRDYSEFKYWHERLAILK